MIFDLVFGFLLSVITKLFTILPSFTGPFCMTPDDGACYSGGIKHVGAYIGYVNRWIDVDLFINVLVGIVALWAVAGTVWVSLWVYRNLPGKAS